MKNLLEFFQAQKLPIISRLNKIWISYLSLGDLHRSGDVWVDDDDENKIIYFVFCFSQIFLKHRGPPQIKTCPAATVHVLKQET